jgi:hypothetical protein
MVGEVEAVGEDEAVGEALEQASMVALAVTATTVRLARKWLMIAPFKYRVEDPTLWSPLMNPSGRWSSAAELVG